MHTPDDQRVSINANDPVWPTYQDLAALLTALCNACNIESDKDLATKARRFPPCNEIGERSIQQWRSGIARPGPGSRKLLEQIRQALGVPDDDTALGKAWRLRVTENNEKRRLRAPKLPRPPKEPIVEIVVYRPESIDEPVKVSSPSNERDALTEPNTERQEGNSEEERQDSILPENEPIVDVPKSVIKPGSENDNRSISYFVHVDRAIEDLLHHPAFITAVTVAFIVLFIIFINTIRSRSDGDDTVSPRHARLELPYDKLHLNKDGFVLPHSSEVALTDNDLQGLNGWQVYVAIDEIFARHGRMPTAMCLITHFQQHRKSNGGWFQPVDGDVGVADLTKIENNSLKKLKTYENVVIRKHFTCETG